jgi:hypothetical protein
VTVVETPEEETQKVETPEEPVKKPATEPKKPSGWKNFKDKIASILDAMTGDED